MKSLKVKLVSVVSAFILALSLLIVGVWAVGQSQTITMEGSVNFNVADKSLYVKDVRMQEDVNSAPYSLKDQDRFMPGFINGNFDMNLGDFTNSYGSFALYFDIINTMDETTNETFAYTVEQPTAPSGTTVSVSILNTEGTTLEQIPQGTVKPSEISDSTLVTATIKLTIASTSSSSVDLSGITITINQFIPQIYDYFTFKVNDDGKTVTLTDYNKNSSDNTDIVIPATVDLVDGVWQDGFTYTVTAIASASSFLNGVFYNSGITSIAFPSTLQSIGNYAFRACRGVTGELNLGGCTSLTSIGSWAFEDCSGLTSVDLSGCTSLTSIGSYAFRDCRGLTSLDLSGCTSLTSIGNSAFSGCSGLTGTVTIPASVTEIGENPFTDCSNLEGIVVEKGNSEYYIKGNCLIENSTKTLITGFNNSTIPSDIKIIGGYAFDDCRGLISITLPSSLTSIGNYAFSDCRGLTGELNLGGCTSLTSIGDSAFSGCSGLTGELNLGECKSLTSIGSSAFDGCSGLTGELNLGGCKSLTSIGSSAFDGCSGLTSLTLPSSITSIGSTAFGSTNINVVNYNGTLSDWLKVSISTAGANSWIVSHRFIINGEELINLEVPEGVESINKGLFSYCSGLKSVTLPSTLKTIERKAFYYCSGLTSVDLSGCTSLTSIGSYAFHGCSGLTSVDLRGCTSLTSIEDDAFSGCTKLTSVDLSGCTSLISIGDSAFSGCSGLTSVDLSGCTSLTSIEDDAFRECRGLTSLDLSGCTNLTSIGRYAFYRCSALKSVVFPEGSTGWYVTQDETATSGDAVDVTNSSTNANNLTGQYSTYYWKRNA